MPGVERESRRVVRIATSGGDRQQAIVVRNSRTAIERCDASSWVEGRRVSSQSLVIRTKLSNGTSSKGASSNDERVFAVDGAMKRSAPAVVMRCGERDAVAALLPEEERRSRRVVCRSIGISPVPKSSLIIIVVRTSGVRPDKLRAGSDNLRARPVICRRV